MYTYGEKFYAEKDHIYVEYVVHNKEPDVDVITYKVTSVTNEDEEELDIGIGEKILWHMGIRTTCEEWWPWKDKEKQ